MHGERRGCARLPIPDLGGNPALALPGTAPSFAYAFDDNPAKSGEQDGGGGGIRTPIRLPVCVAFDHSATSPQRKSPAASPHDEVFGGGMTRKRLGGMDAGSPSAAIEKPPTAAPARTISLLGRVGTGIWNHFAIRKRGTEQRRQAAMLGSILQKRECRTGFASARVSSPLLVRAYSCYPIQQRVG